ncbi:MAG: hypothetical protein M9924_21215 [Rhizobiaceae bacterium]|nr:hypothetical protein [Rhizobiaceae bacterium]
MVALLKPQQRQDRFPVLPHVTVTPNMASLATPGAPIRLNRAMLSKLGYGAAALDTLEAGVAITYSEDDTPALHTIREFPDGARYLQHVTWLGDRRAWKVETIKRLPDAAR